MTLTTDQIIQSGAEEMMVHCLCSGNERLFAKLYDRYSAAIFGLIIKWINDSGTSENLLQEVFLKAWRNRHLYDAEKGRIFTWLHNITRNVCIDHMRSKAHKKSRVSVLHEDLSELLKTGSSERFLPDIIGLKRIIRTLKHEEKEVVELMYFKGLTQKEIAEIMNVPLGTVKTRVSRAIRNLRCFFANDWEHATRSILLN
ncbi:MAG: RNA polymerase sigma factor [Chitinophagaceae bacterium]